MPHFWNDDQTLEVAIFFNFMYFTLSICEFQVSNYLPAHFIQCFQSAAAILNINYFTCIAGTVTKISVPITNQNTQIETNLIYVVTKLVEDGFFKEKKRWKGKLMSINTPDKYAGL